MAAEERADAVEQSARSTTEQRISVVKHEAWLRAEEDRVKIARMLARICELEKFGGQESRRHWRIAARSC